MSVVDSLPNESIHDDHSSVKTIHDTDSPPGNLADTSLTLDPKDESVKTTKICYHFQRAGRCRFGSKCRYQHDDESVRNLSKLSKTDDSHSQSTKKLSTKSCFEFTKSGECRFGEKCKFSHTVKGSKVKDESVVGNSDQPDIDPGSPEKHKEQTTDQLQPKKRVRVCRYFKQGSCKKGSACNFRHPESKQHDAAEEGDRSLPQEGSEKGGETKEPVARTKVQIQTFLRLSELTDEDLQRLRQTEIVQLKKRFPNHLEMENEGHPSVYRIVVHPTDPDWPYNVTSFQMNVSFPFEYPTVPPTIGLPEEQDVPSVVLRHMATAMQEWILGRQETNKMGGRAEIIFRPFLRWFDKNLETLFTEGARKLKREVDVERAGFEFVPNVKDNSVKDEHAQPSLPEDAIIISKPKGQQLTDDHDQPDDNDKLSLALSEMRTSSDEDEQNSSDNETDSSSKAGNVIFDPPDKDMRGTEIIYQGLKMSESVASLAVVKLTVIVQCSRCKTHMDVTTPPRRNNLITCEKCSHRQILTYRPCLVHPLSHVIGFLDMDGCLPFDVNLVTSTLTVGCLSCSHDNNLRGIQYGQARNLWCDKCHQKMTVEAESCRFQRLQPAENIGAGPLHAVPPKGTKRHAKDPAIVDMLPLPANGSCKHYKKSFRWLRFPCCGKFFPCDECHDLDNSDGHEMKYATRMLCGFCAKEQPYSVDKPCVRCGSATTKGRTQHWEGGTGCRNKIKMSRNDKQKYAGVTKTMSKKAHNKSELSSKGK